MYQESGTRDEHEDERTRSRGLTRRIAWQWQCKNSAFAAQLNVNTCEIFGRSRLIIERVL